MISAKPYPLVTILRETAVFTADGQACILTIYAEAPVTFLKS